MSSFWLASSGLFEKNVPAAHDNSIETSSKELPQSNTAEIESTTHIQAKTNLQQSQNVELMLNTMNRPSQRPVKDESMFTNCGKRCSSKCE